MISYVHIFSPRVLIAIHIFAAASIGKIICNSTHRDSYIARLTPGLRLTPSGGTDISGNRQNISIRGISSNVGAATTGIYLDDTPIQARSVGNAVTNAYPQIFDLDRVEVLRGPQGTLFGAGAEGGAVRFILPQPSVDAFSGYARTEVAFTENGSPSYEAGAAIGGPISKGTLGFRLSGWYRHDGGYVDRVNATTGQTVENDSNDQDSFSVRGALKWQPTDALDVTLAVYHQDIKQHGTNLLFENLSDLDKGVFRNGRRLPQSSRDRFTLPSLTVEYDAGSVKLISNSSSFHRDASVDIDYSDFITALFNTFPGAIPGNSFFLPGEYAAASIADRQRSFTQEVRLQSNNADSRLNWVIGAFYSRARQNSLQINYDPFFDEALTRRYGLTAQQFFGQPLLVNEVSFINDLKVVDEQKALFGQVDFELLKGLKLTAGLRAAQSTVEFSSKAQGPVNGGATSVSGKQSEKPVTPKFGVAWQADRDNLFYASVAKGYRVGGINGPQIALCNPFFAQLGINQPDSYKSDSVWSYELGSKNRLFGGKVRVDASVFHIDWSNIQRSIRIAQCGSTFTTNLGKAKSDGFDIAVDLRPTDGLSLGFSIGYTSARLTESVSGVPLNGVTPLFAQKGDKIGGAPWNYTASAQYEFEIATGRKAYLRGDFQHTGEGVPLNYTIVGADSTLPPSEKFDQLSLRAGVKVGKLDVSAFVNNLLDEAPLNGRFRDNLTSPQYFNLTARPRTFGVTAAYRY